MKALKILTLLALTGSTALIADNTQAAGNHGNQYNIQIGDAPAKQMKKKHRKMTMERKIGRILRHLDLTQAQKDKLKTIRKEMWQARKAQNKKLRGSLALKKFVSVDGFDKESFITASELRAKETAKNRADMMEKTIAVLTPEQRVTLVEQLNKPRKQRRPNRRPQN